MLCNRRTSSLTQLVFAAQHQFSAENPELVFALADSSSLPALVATVRSVRPARASRPWCFPSGHAFTLGFHWLLV
jgi:hypothetical protein